jgi:hypothetical protein
MSDQFLIMLVSQIEPDSDLQWPTLAQALDLTDGDIHDILQDPFLETRTQKYMKVGYTRHSTGPLPRDQDPEVYEGRI